MAYLRLNFARKLSALATRVPQGPGKPLFIGGFVLLGGLTCGLVTVYQGPWLGFLILAELVYCAAVLARPLVGVFGTIVLLYLLPFGVNPVPLGSFHLTFLDISLSVTLWAWVLRVLSRQERTLVLSPVGAPLLLFLGLAVVALLFGVTLMSAERLRLFFKMINSILFFFTIINVLRSRREVEAAAKAVVLGAGAAGALALALYLLPAYIFLVLRARRSLVRSAALLALPIAAGVLTLLILRYRMSDLPTPFQTLGVAVISSGGGEPLLAAGRIQMLQRAVDVANLCWLVLPVPALILVTRVLELRRTPPCWKPQQVFLAVAAVCGLLAAFALVLPGSPAQDWDLMSLIVLPLAVLAISLLPALGPAAGRRSVAWGLGMLSVAPALSFVLVNADAQAGLRRFKMLVSPAALLSTHERAYGNEKLVKLYMARGQHDSVLVYATRAVEAESTNTRYWGNVGTALYNLRRYPEAAFYFGEAAKRGSARPEVHYYLGQSLMRAHRYREALEPLQRAIDLGGEQQQFLFSLGLARAGSGDLEGARRVWSYILSKWPGDRRTAQAFRDYFGEVPE